MLYEPEAGYLLARRACDDVVARVVAEGGAYAQAAVAGPIRPRGGRLANVRVAGIAPLEADAFVFACGPWLGALFPDVIGRRITPTRQDVYYFGTPAGDPRYAESELPIWLEVGERLFYGIPGNAHRGFKISDDTSGPRFDPTSGERTVLPDGLRRARAFLKRRFPELARAPLTGTEVCQYEATPDSDYILDRHPARRQRLDRRRRLRPRLQDGAGDRRSARRCDSRQRADGAGVFSRALRAAFEERGEMDVVRLEDIAQKRIDIPTATPFRNGATDNDAVRRYSGVRPLCIASMPAPINAPTPA